MSDYTYTVLSDATGEVKLPENPLSQITEEQIKKNFCFIVTPELEVIFFKNAAMWNEAKKILEGYEYKVFWCMEVLKASRSKKIK